MTRTGITPAQLDSLHQPTPRDEVRQRQGPGGRLLDYVDARYVMDRLDSLGGEVWQDAYEQMADGAIRCGIGILIDGEWVWKFDVGVPSDIEPELGAFSHAFKRAAVKWGVARDLYAPQGAAGARQPVARPATAPAQPATPSAPHTQPQAHGGVPVEPDYVREQMGQPQGRPMPQQARDDVDSREGFCPQHGMAWVLKPAGSNPNTGKSWEAFWACPSTDRPFCKARPSDRWKAIHEVTA